MKFNFSDFRHVDCSQFQDNAEMFFALWEATYHNPCEGCFLNSGDIVKKCKGYTKLVNKTKHLEKSEIRPGPTNAVIASKLGISKRQVAKLRKNGSLKTMMEESGIN